MIKKEKKNFFTKLGVSQQRNKYGGPRQHDELEQSKQSRSDVPIPSTMRNDIQMKENNRPTRPSRRNLAPEKKSRSCLKCGENHKPYEKCPAYC